MIPHMLIHNLDATVKNMNAERPNEAVDCLLHGNLHQCLETLYIFLKSGHFTVRIVDKAWL